MKVVGLTLSEPPQKMIEMALQSLNIATSHRLVGDIEAYGKDCDIIVLPPLCPLDVSVFNFSRTSELIERAEANIHQWMALGGLEGRAGSLAVLRPHAQ